MNSVQEEMNVEGEAVLPSFGKRVIKRVMRWWKLSSGLGVCHSIKWRNGLTGWVLLATNVRCRFVTVACPLSES